MTNKELTMEAVNTIRFLSVDGVQKANSGHPGLPMGTAAMAYTVWSRHLRFDPKNPDWPNRDRFILSAGHGSMLLYSLLHLTGYDLSLDDLKNFRQWESKTPGHPEYGEAPGVEVTTGPLGQGLANGVGMAIAESHLAAMYNQDGFPVIDNFIYAIVSDGDLMEGVSHEAASLAGHLQLGKLIYLYDDNHISIDGSTDLAFTENRVDRFLAYGWHVTSVDDAYDVEAIDQAIQLAKSDPRPSLIVLPTLIGYGLPTREGTAKAHGEPPGQEEIDGAKERLGWPLEPHFLIPERSRAHFLEIGERGASLRQDWLMMMERFAKDHPELAKQFARTQAQQLPENLADHLPVFNVDEKGLATRASSGEALNALAAHIPELIGGSADLTGSNKTDIKGESPYSADDRSGRYIHFGVREHGMGSALNGIARYGGLIPYGGTFLIFTDYLRPTLRLASLMDAGVIFVMTHDSIGLGEDGPTHQPIEHLAAIRAIPGIVLLRPGDANETAQAWLLALQRRDGPTVLSLTRQALPTLDRSIYAAAEMLARGAYTLADLGEGDPQVILMGTGSEVQIALEAGHQLASGGVPNRVVSMPSWELFRKQSDEYKAEVLPDSIQARVAIEAGASLGWSAWIGSNGAFIGLDRFGASAPYEQIYENLGLTSSKIVEAAHNQLARVGETD